MYQDRRLEALIVDIIRHLFRSMVDLLYETQQCVRVFRDIKVRPRDTLDLCNLARWRIGVILMRQEEDTMDVRRGRRGLVRANAKIEAGNRLLRSILPASCR
jgi:hypothetical protein